MPQKTGEILNFRVVQVTEATSSVAMEKEGFQRCVDDLIASGFQFTCFATDRHTGIALLCHTEYYHVNHQFDVWHVSKGPHEEAHPRPPNRRENRICHLGQSQSAITCGGRVRHAGRDALCLKEKWISVLHHCCNEHTWGDSEKFTSCAHPPLVPEKIDGKRWLLLGSTSHQALQSIVLNKTLIKALDQMTEANHTGALEVYHSLLFKHCEKQNHFSREEMIARTALAALDNNHNV